MAKRPKEVKKIDIEYLDMDEEDKPECFESWEEGCDEKLCGPYFKECKYQSTTEPF